MGVTTGRAALGGPAAAVNRRSAIGCEQKSSSTDKTNSLDTDSLNTRFVELGRRQFRLLAVIIMKAFIATSPKYPTFAVLTDSWTDRRTYVWRMKSYLEKYFKKAILFEDGFLDYSEIFQIISNNLNLRF